VTFGPAWAGERAGKKIRVVLIDGQNNHDWRATTPLLKKELEKIEKELGNNQKQMGNEQFLAKAPAQVVEGLRTRAAELGVLREKCKSKLAELGC